MSSGRGTPTSTTVPARSRASNAWRYTVGLPTASMHTSAPKPPVTDLMYSTGSVVDELHVWVAPNSLAHSSLRSSMSTATIVEAPASCGAGDGGVADAAAAEHGDRLAARRRRRC